jgi:predicted  nucleic acid-binding Zn-ribbon protein
MKALLQNLIQLQSLESGGVKNKNVEASLAELRAKIPSQILAHYDRLVARKKKGVAAVRGQVCSGCHMQVPLGVVMTLRRGQDIQICESCGRYLYLPPTVETEATEPAARPKPERKKRKQIKQPLPAA